jgi:peroxiredoxin
MARVELNQMAPDFELASFSGETVRLSDYRNRKNVVLVFNRGFL